MQSVTKTKLSTIFIENLLQIWHDRCWWGNQRGGFQGIAVNVAMRTVFCLLWPGWVEQLLQPTWNLKIHPHHWLLYAVALVVRWISVCAWYACVCALNWVWGMGNILRLAAALFKILNSKWAIQKIIWDMLQLMYIFPVCACVRVWQ